MKRAALLIPAIALFLLTFAVPMIIVMRLSLFESDYMKETFVGFMNYVDAAKDRFYTASFMNAMILTVMISPLAIILSYSLSSFLMGFNERTQAVGRFLIYVPGLASGIIMALLWEWFLHRKGLINSAFGLSIPWLTEKWPSRLSLVMINLTGGLGANTILFSAAMHQLSKELKDAAMIDGASERQYKRYIVRPIMMPTVLLLLLLSIVGMMQIWESIYILWQNGGPEGSMASPVYEIFMTAFQFGKQGLAAAKGVILMLVIATILFIKQRLEKWLKQ